MCKGTLYLIPSVLADGNVNKVIPEGTLQILHSLDHFIVEELRTARRYLIKARIPRKIDDLTFYVFNEHSTTDNLEQFLGPAMEGHSIGLLSEAGVPCVADPGAMIVKFAHQAGIKVVPLTGPSSILLALMASGFNGQNFSFAGYLPTDSLLRSKRIKELENRMQAEDQTQIFIEAPYRNLQLFDALIRNCHPETLLCIAVDITAESEHILALPVKEWRRKTPDIQKRNTIFLIYHQ